MKEMTLKVFITFATDELREQYEEKEANAIVQRLIADYYNMETAELSMHLSNILDEKSVVKLKSDLSRLKKYEPIQYVTGKAYFDDLVLEIRKPVLIPRPETEELFYKAAEFIEKQYNKEKKFRILDIGTGSGCLALALKKRFPHAELVAVDIIEEALALAKQNAVNLGLEIEVMQLDILKDIPKDNFDVIISNPPYVRESEKKLMQVNVLRYESETALFVADNDALCFYKRIAEVGKQCLKKNGSIFLEINESFGEQTQALYLDKGYENMTLKKDFRGRNRFLFGFFKKKCKKHAVN
jgi:release factor glutamine methyltransferase